MGRCSISSGVGVGVAKKIEAGMVWINSSNDSDWRIPFGGVKQCTGRELGEAGRSAYSNIKAIHVNMKSVGVLLNGI